MTKAIKFFSMSRLPIAACLTFHKRVQNQIELSTPQALHIEAQVSRYFADIDKLQTVVNRQRGFVATAELKAADQRRDNACGVIVNVVKANTTSAVDEKCAAAGPLATRIAPYKGIQKHMYAKQTGEVDGLLNVLDRPENAAAIALLGLESEVEALRQANQLFVTALDEKADERTEMMNLSDIDSRQLLGELADEYEQIRQIVNVMYLLQPSEAISVFIDKVNGQVGNFAAMIDGTPSSGEGGTPAEGEGGSGAPEGEGGTGTPEGEGNTSESGNENEGDTPTPPAPEGGGNSGGGSDPDEEIIG